MSSRDWTQTVPSPPRDRDDITERGVYLSALHLQ